MVRFFQRFVGLNITFAKITIPSSAPCCRSIKNLLCVISKFLISHLGRSFAENLDHNPLIQAVEHQKYCSFAITPAARRADFFCKLFHTEVFSVKVIQDLFIFPEEFLNSSFQLFFRSLCFFPAPEIFRIGIILLVETL